MKKLIIPFVILLGIHFLSGCTKWADDKSNIYIYQAPPPPNGISDSTPLCGSVKGTMLTGKTYTLGCTINVPAGDTLILQQGVTVNANINSGIIVHGTMISLGTQAQPNYLTVPGVAKNTTPNLPLAQDSAHVGLWKGIMCDTSCPMLVLKWTHLDFAGATYEKTPVSRNIEFLEARQSCKLDLNAFQFRGSIQLIYLKDLDTIS